MSRTRGREHRVRLPGRSDPPCVRRDARISLGSPRAGSPRAGRLAHGRRLRAGRRRRRRRDGNLRTRGDESGHRHRHRHDGLGTDGLHHRPGTQQADRLRRVPGNRHHRHHAADHQAQLSGDADRRHHAGDEGGLPPGEVGPSGPGAGGHHQGCAAGVGGLGLGSVPGEAAGLPAQARDAALAVEQGRRVDPRLEEAGDPGRTGHPAQRRDAGSEGLRRAHQRAGGDDACWAWARFRPATR